MSTLKSDVSNGHDPDTRLILVELRALRSGVDTLGAQLAETHSGLAELRREISDIRVVLVGLHVRIVGIERRLDGGA